jgi:endoglucanase
VLWAWKLTGDAKYLAWIVRTCDNTLGANALGLCYVTGLGSRSVHAPLHNSRYGQSGEVAPGMTVEGPNERGEGYRVADVTVPKLRDNFASLYSFVDCHFAIAMDEGVVPAQAEMMAVFGLLGR